MRVAYILPAAMLSACATGPYSELSGRLGSSPDLDVAGVLITGVDDQAYFDGKMERQVAPGPHALMLATKRKGRRGSDVPGYLFVKAEPCMRYYIVARHATGLEADQWAPEVARVEAIEGCKVTEAPP